MFNSAKNCYDNDDEIINNFSKNNEIIPYYKLDYKSSSSENGDSTDSNSKHTDEKNGNKSELFLENLKPEINKIYENNENDNLLSLQIKYGLNQIYNYCANKNVNFSSLPVLNYYCCNFLEKNKNFNKSNNIEENKFL